MASTSKLPIYAGVAVLAYAVLVGLFVRIGPETIGLMAWNAAPLAAPLLIVAFARRRAVRLGGALLLAVMWAVGAAVLLWGLVLNPGDYNHLVALFLPIHEFIWLAIGLPVLWLASVVLRRIRARSADSTRS